MFQKSQESEENENRNMFRVHDRSFMRLFEKKKGKKIEFYDFK